MLCPIFNVLILLLLFITVFGQLLITIGALYTRPGPKKKIDSFINRDSFLVIFKKIDSRTIIDFYLFNGGVKSLGGSVEIFCSLGSTSLFYHLHFRK